MKNKSEYQCILQNICERQINVFCSKFANIFDWRMLSGISSWLAMFQGFLQTYFFTSQFFCGHLCKYLATESCTCHLPGWVSDDELGCSSGSESRESSAGAGGRHFTGDPAVLPRPPGHGTPRARRKPRMDPFTALTLDIPSKLHRFCIDCRDINLITVWCTIELISRQSTQNLYSVLVSCAILFYGYMVASWFLYYT